MSLLFILEYLSDGFEANMKKSQAFKSGEKIMFIIFGVFFLLAVVAYVAMESIRHSSKEPMFKQTTHDNFTKEGKAGSVLYHKANCNSCHRALQTGTSMGLSLDGIGSLHDLKWLEAFLKNPEKTYGAPTLDHGFPPKEAAYVMQMPEKERHLIAVFLSELKADAGSSEAPKPPPERSEFIDNMVKTWAPKEWKEKYRDVRTEQPKSAKESEKK